MKPPTDWRFCTSRLQARPSRGQAFPTQGCHGGWMTGMQRKDQEHGGRRSEEGTLYRRLLNWRYFHFFERILDPGWNLTHSWRIKSFTPLTCSAASGLLKRYMHLERWLSLPILNEQGGWVWRALQRIASNFFCSQMESVVQSQAVSERQTQSPQSRAPSFHWT